MPAGVRTRHDPESVVITVAGSIREEAVVPVTEGEAAAEGAEPEVLKEKKKEEGVDAAAGKAAGPAGGAAKKEETKK